MLLRMKEKSSIRETGEGTCRPQPHNCDIDFSASTSMIKRIKETVDNEMTAHKWPVTLSIGAITFKKFDAGINEMIKLADDLMYEVKRKGKNDIKHSVFT